ncbi:MAG TPA: 2-amino-4-oxopentanoate thiolase subunit OrtA [Candidatus Limnocylindrales bacterium]|nr:2-amino-4-oxopentanoate thiolase subunit OrtA [Candidatus Limnocylindrales bacterium]
MANPPRSAATDVSLVPAGAWVEISQVVLPAGGRAPNVPPDTGETDFVARIRGFLVESASIGDEATVRTLVGREVAGRLTAVNPRNPADFGDPVPELLALGSAARRALEGPDSR